jgi:hypothetical protein
MGGNFVQVIIFFGVVGLTASLFTLVMVARELRSARLRRRRDEPRFEPEPAAELAAGDGLDRR